MKLQSEGRKFLNLIWVSEVKFRWAFEWFWVVDMNSK